ETVRARQQAVDELRPRVDLREDLAVLAEEARTGVNPVSLAAWGETPVLLEPGIRISIFGFTIPGISAAAAIGVPFVAPVPQNGAMLPRHFLLLGNLAKN